MRIILFVLGWFFVALGVIGIFVPLIPTVSPLLVALACFSRSSPRFYNWLYYHPVLGPPLQQWKNNRTIPKKSKYIAVSSIVVSGSISLYCIHIWAVQVGLALFLSLLIVMLLRIPNSEEKQAEQRYAEEIK